MCCFFIVRFDTPERIHKYYFKLCLLQIDLSMFYKVSHRVISQSHITYHSWKPHHFLWNYSRSFYKNIKINTLQTQQKKKKNKFLCTITWINITDILLNVRSLMYKSAYSMIPFILSSRETIPSENSAVFYLWGEEGMKMDKEGAQGNLLGWWKCFISWSGWGYMGIEICKNSTASTVKLHILNCVYVYYTPQSNS